MPSKLQYCRTCQKRANCHLYRENNFCALDSLILDDIYEYNKENGYKIARSKEFETFTNAQRSEELNPDCLYFKKIREEIKDLLQFFKEMREEEGDDEDDGLQESESMATKP